jgi:bacterioferritin (cytochrome b1)
MKLSDNERWLLSFYRTSEISGSLFFGRLARSMRPGPVQCDMTKHFADEAQHAYYWTECIQHFGEEPYKLSLSYQDQYVSACGIPANLMEVLAITQIFEKRVINQYAKHIRVPGLQPKITQTIERIMEDEKWHIQWVRDALKAMEPKWGKDYIDETKRKFRDADQEVYEKTMKEHEDRIGELFSARQKVA